MLITPQVDYVWMIQDPGHFQWYRLVYIIVWGIGELFVCSQNVAHFRTNVVLLSKVLQEV